MSKKYSVMIVDDEATIRENLPVLIDFGGAGFEVIATAKNGLDAMNRIKEKKPDVLMVDISMPIMDGLGLIECLQEDGLDDILVIILSGYSDFEYARKAVRLGVKAYLTKPVDEDDAMEILRGMYATLEERDRIHCQLQIDNAKKELDHTYVAGLNPSASSEDKLLCCVALSYKEDSSLFEVFREVSYEIFQNYDLLIRAEGCFYIYYLPDNFIRDRFIDAWDVAERFYQRLEEKGMTALVVVDDKLLQYHEVFQENYHRFRSELMYRAFYGKTGICGVGLKKMPETQHCFVEQTDKLLSELKDFLRYGDESGACLAFEKIANVIRQHRPVLDKILSINYRLLTMFSEAMELPEHYNRFIDPLDWNNSTYYTGLPKWVSIHKKIILEACTLVTQKRKFDDLGIYGEILNFVSANYNQPITVKEVAERYYLNAAYLGRMFPKVTGKGFKQYINDLRITEAKRLLEQTDRRIYEIAEQVGYAESKYFITRFVRATGLSPGEYRQQCTNISGQKSNNR